MRLLHKRPWLLVVLAFLLLISAWASLIVVAVKHRPESIDLPHAAQTEEPTSESTHTTP